MPTRINSLSQLKGLSDKRACLVATVGNIAFTGITQIDGVTLSNDDRVLVWQQSTPSQNGIYILSGSTNLVRALDSKNVNDFIQGTQYLVVSGNTYSETLFYLKNKVTTLGVDNIIIDIFGGLNGTSGSSGSSGTSGGTGSSGTSATSGSSGTSGSNAGITSYTNPADNRVITSVSSTAINAEANLTFDGSILDVNTTAAFKLPVGTTAERPGSPTTGYMRYNTTASVLEIYLGGRWQQLLVSDYLIAEYLVIAGGGAGGGGVNFYEPGGGGGAGGYLTGTLTLTSMENTIIVGAGGAGTIYTDSSGSGTNSVFSTITAIGGGGGADYNEGGKNGGSGGGGAELNAPGTGIVGQGFAGGTGISAGGGGSTASGGGGGGSSSVGANGTNSTGGGGGSATYSSITGSSIPRAGGGGGGGITPGLGGGGGAGNAIYQGNGQIASSNTGSGGGSSQATGTGNYSGGNGGSGVVIIRYSNTYPNLTLSTGFQYATPGSSGATTTNITSFGVYAPSYTPTGFKVYEFRSTGGVPLNISWQY